MENSSDNERPASVPVNHPAVLSADIPEMDVQVTHDNSESPNGATNGAELEPRGRKRKPEELERDTDAGSSSSTNQGPDEGSPARGSPRASVSEAVDGPGPDSADQDALFALAESLRTSIAEAAPSAKVQKPNTAESSAMERLDRIRRLHATGSAVPVDQECSTRTRSRYVAPTSPPRANVVLVPHFGSADDQRLERGSMEHFPRHSIRYEQLRLDRRRELRQQIQLPEPRPHPRTETRARGGRPESRQEPPTRVPQPSPQPTAEPDSQQNTPPGPSSQSVGASESVDTSSQLCVHPHLRQPSPQVAHSFLALLHPIHDPQQQQQQQQSTDPRPHNATPDGQSPTPFFQHPHAQLFAPNIHSTPLAETPEMASLLEVSISSVVSGRSAHQIAQLAGQQTAGQTDVQDNGQDNVQDNVQDDDQDDDQGDDQGDDQDVIQEGPEIDPETARAILASRALYFQTDSGGPSRPTDFLYTFSNHFTASRRLLHSTPLPQPFVGLPPTVREGGRPAGAETLEDSMFLEAQTRSLQDLNDINIPLGPGENRIPPPPEKESPEGFTRSLKSVGASADAVVCVGCNAPLMGAGVSWFVRGCGHLYCKTCSTNTSKCGTANCESFQIIEKDSRAEASLGRFREVFF